MIDHSLLQPILTDGELEAEFLFIVLKSHPSLH